MKNLYFVGCLAAAALLSVGLGACSSEEVVEEITSVEQQPDDAAALIDFGEFPAFGGGTRAASVGKTGYEEGDEMKISLYESVESKEVFASCTYKYTSDGTWEPADDSQTALTQQNLTAAALWLAEFTQNHADGALNGTYEKMTSKPKSYTPGDPIVISLSRNYSRLRVHTGIPELENVKVTLSNDYFAPDEGSRSSAEFTLTADGNGDVIIYGTFNGGCKVTASIDGAPNLDSYPYLSYGSNKEKSFSDASVVNTSYLLNTDLGWMTLDVDAASNSNSSEVPMYISLFGYSNFYWKIVSTTATELPRYFESNSVKVVDMSGASSITTITDYCFRNSSLQSITLPENLKKIGDQAFKGCLSLTSITLGSTITLMGTNAFQNCTSLETVTLDRIMSHVLGSFSDNVFSGCTGLKQIVCYISKDDNEGYAIQDYSYCLSNLFNITNTEGNFPTIYVSDGYEELVGKTVGSAFTVKSIDEYTE